MPIEIKELVIKATVNTDAQQATVAPADLSEIKEKIVTACVEQVLQVLKEKKER